MHLSILFYLAQLKFKKILNSIHLHFFSIHLHLILIHRNQITINLNWIIFRVDTANI